MFWVILVSMMFNIIPPLCKCVKYTKDLTSATNNYPEDLESSILRLLGYDTGGQIIKIWVQFNTHEFS